MENPIKTPSPEQMKLQRSNYIKQMKADIDILELDAKFWENKFKALQYKTAYAELEAKVQQDLMEMEAQMKAMQEQVLKTQGDLPSEEVPAPSEELVEN